MNMKRKFTIVVSLVAGLFICAAAIEPGNQTAEFKNLQVLPKDISENALQRIMEIDCNKALGVNCDFCHSPSKLQPGNLDFASDSNVMKGNARRMMRLTIEINKTWFYFDTASRPEYLKVITCKTCHQGHPFPPEN